MKVVTYIHKGKVMTLSIEDLKKMKVELTQKWESLCQKCGKCCFDKKLTNDNVLVIDYDSPCKHLKFLGRKAMCDVYSDRFTKGDRCNTIPEAIEKRYLPGSCPYVKSTPAYKAPVDNGDWYKRAREKVLSKAGEFSGAGEYTQPTGGTRNEAVALPVRQDMDRGKKEWQRRRKEQKQRLHGGKQGNIDPREKTEYDIKPSGHGLGG